MRIAPSTHHTACKMTHPPTLAEIEAAAARVDGHVRRLMTRSPQPPRDETAETIKGIKRRIEQHRMTIRRLQARLRELEESGHG